MRETPLTREEVVYLLRGQSDGQPLGSPVGTDAAFRLALLRWPDGGELPTAVAETLRDSLEQPLRERWLRTAKALTQQFSTILRTVVEVEPRCPSSATPDRFPGEEEHAVCRWSLELGGSGGLVWLSMELSLTRSLLDRLLGGQLAPYCGPCRALTELETQLALRIAEACREAVQAAWPELRLSAASPEASPSPHRNVTDAVARGDFEIRSGALTGNLALTIPWRRVLDICCAQASGAADSPNAEFGPSGAVVSAIVARATIPQEDLNRLEVGDLIPVNQVHDQLVQVVVDGRVRFLARPGEIEGRRAIRIE